MDGLLGLVGCVLDVRAADVHVLGPDVEGRKLALERGYVGEAVLEPDAEPLDARRRFQRLALVVGPLLEECRGEHQGPLAFVEGVTNDRGGKRVDVDWRTHDADDAKGVRRAVGRRQVAVAASCRLVVCLRRIRPHRHSAAHVQVAESRRDVIDDRFVGVVEPSESPAQDLGPVHGAEGVAVGRREGVDAPELSPLFVGRQEHVWRPPGLGDLGEMGEPVSVGDGLGDVVPDLLGGRVRGRSADTVGARKDGPVDRDIGVLGPAVGHEALHGRVGAAGTGHRRHHHPAGQADQQDERDRDAPAAPELGPRRHPHRCHGRIVAGPGGSRTGRLPVFQRWWQPVKP